MAPGCPGSGIDWKNIKFIFRNPCKKCIVRPCCVQTCENKKHYGETQMVSAMIVSLVIIPLSGIVGYIILK